MQTQQWYEVLRPDGTKQYATKGVFGYLLWGAGFEMKLEAISITPVKEVPVELVEGTANFDDCPEWRALIDKNQWWNGWAMPYIHAKHVEDVIDYTQGDPDDEYGAFLTLKDGIITVDDRGAPEIFTIEPTVINGELWYYFGHMGWCWNFTENK